MPQEHRVVVVGGGFGGLNVTRSLADADVDVTVVEDKVAPPLVSATRYPVAFATACHAAATS